MKENAKFLIPASPAGRSNSPSTSRYGAGKLRKHSLGRVAVGLSGGVDSAVSAAILKEQGYDVTGVFLVCWKEPGCRTDQDRKDALSVALRLGIPFRVLDFRKEYKKRVVDYFYDEYRVGRTPNPDTMCNREIKFGLFYKWALRLHSGSSTLRHTNPQDLRPFDYIATGHYARIGERSQKALGTRQKYFLLKGVDEKKDPRKVRNGGQRGKQSYQLLRGVDERKDQSYFLYQLKSEQLEHILFPVGHLKKDEVRRAARKWNLPVAAKPDSQGICFIGDVDVQALLRQRLAVKKGEVVVIKCKVQSAKCKIGKHDESCYQVVGEHDGVWFYTIGQRRGFRINEQKAMSNEQWRHAVPPFYVIRKDVKHNRLVVGFGAETYQSQFAVEDCNWLNQESGIRNQEWRNGFRVRIRHGGALIPAESIIRNSKFIIRLHEPQRGVAPGQAAVFYGEHDEVLGGGVIH